MKKAITFLIILLVAAGAAGAFYFLYWQHARPLGDLQAAGYVPSDAFGLVEITDWQRTKTRWKETALYKISQEPEVAAFLAKPKSLVPAGKATDMLERFRALEPKEAFIAAAGQNANGPKVVAGFDFTGSKKDAEELVADLKGDLKMQFLDGQSEVQKHGSDVIETFTHQGMTLATVFKGRWFFASNDLDLLNSTLDRVDGKIDAKTSLRENALYQTSIAKLPKDSDGVAFVQMQDVMPSLILMLSTTPNADTSQLDELKKIQSISVSMKLDGENMRDAIYFYKPGGEARAPLANNAMGFTSTETIVEVASALNLKNAPVLPDPSLDKTGILAMLSGLQQALAQAGLGFDDFKAAFGPEFGTVVNWGVKPDGIFTLDVKDRAKAKKFIDTLATGWPNQEIDGNQFYALAPVGVGVIEVSPVLALTDKAVLFGTDLNAVKKAVQIAKSNDAKLDKSANFQAAAGLVGKPTDAFAYIDTRALFENVYGLASTILKGMALINSHFNDYGDMSKLPSAEVISKHLGPIVCSQATDENGSLFESAGPVTFTGLMFGGGVGAGVMSAVEARAAHATSTTDVVEPSNSSTALSNTAPAPGKQSAPATP